MAFLGARFTWGTTQITKKTQVHLCLWCEFLKHGSSKYCQNCVGLKPQPCQSFSWASPRLHVGQTSLLRSSYLVSLGRSSKFQPTSHVCVCCRGIKLNVLWINDPQRTHLQRQSFSASQPRHPMITRHCCHCLLTISLSAQQTQYYCIYLSRLLLAFQIWGPFLLPCFHIPNLGFTALVYLVTWFVKGKSVSWIPETIMRREIVSDVTH